MNISNAERVILMNQYSLLKKLDPDKSDLANWAIQVMAKGYDNEYSRVFSSMGDYSFRMEPISSEIRDEVIDILLMYADLKSSYDRLSPKPAISSDQLEFRGFDFNNESDYATYAEYFISRPENNAVHGMSVPNTHMPTLDGHRRRLNEYRNVADNLSITADELNKIIDA